MSNLVNIDYKDYQIRNLCNIISQCAMNIDELSKYYSKIGRKIPISSYANFRDVFTHFRKAYEAYDELTLSNQCYAAEEHAQRCIKDACVFLSKCYIGVFENVIKGSASLSNYQQYILNEFVELKNDSAWNIHNIDMVIHQLMYDIDVKIGYEDANIVLNTEKDLKDYVCRAKDRSYREYDSKYDYIRSELAQCFFYIMNKKQDIFLMREKMHRLKAIVAKLRDESVGLTRLYTKEHNIAFKSFCDEVVHVHVVIEECGLAGALLLLG